MCTGHYKKWVSFLHWWCSNFVQPGNRTCSMPYWGQTDSKHRHVMHWTKCTWGLHVYTDTYTETYIRSYMQYTRITYIINTHTVSRKDLRGLLRLCRLRRLEVDYVTNSVLNELTFIRIKNQNKKASLPSTRF